MININDLEKNGWEYGINKIINADCLEVMRKMPDNCVNLIVCDPPYFNIKGDFDFNMTKKQWEELHSVLAVEFKRILTDNGSLLLFGHAKNIAYQQVIFDEYFNLENSLVWEKTECHTRKGVGQFRCFAPVTERILFYSKENVNIENNCVTLCRDYLRSEITKAKGDISFKKINSVFESATNGGGVASAVLSLKKEIPAFITKDHYLKLRQWLNKKEYKYLKKEYEDLRRPFNNIFKLTDVMKFSQEVNITGKYKHPTQKPPKLIEALIQTCSRGGDLVLDPMAGSFSTARACLDTGRNFISCDMEKEYCEIGENRLKQQNLF